MKACIYTAPEAPLEVTELPDPVAGAGEVVVRVRNCGICGSDIHAAHYGMGMPPRTVMGHEFSGVIEEVGAGVSDLKPGDAVVAMSYLACGECEDCRRGTGFKCARMRLVGFGDVPGAYAEKMKTTPASCFRMPPGMDHRLGATVEPLVVGLHGVHRARLRAGETCLILGAGPIGLMTLAWARFAGARAIVVSEKAEGRYEKAREMGADVVVHPQLRNPAAAMRELAGAPPDVVFECVGSSGTLMEAVSYAGRGSRVVVIGAYMQDDLFQPMAALNRELDIHFSLGLEAGEVETTIAMLSAGRISTAPMITHTVSLEDLPDAFAALSRPSDQTKLMLEL